MSYHKKYREWYYKVDELVFYKLPNHGRYKHTFITGIYENNLVVPKTYKLGYTLHNPIFLQTNLHDISALEKILKRVY